MFRDITIIFYFNRFQILEDYLSSAETEAKKAKSTLQLIIGKCNEANVVVRNVMIMRLNLSSTYYSEGGTDRWRVDDVVEALHDVSYNGVVPGWSLQVTHLRRLPLPNHILSETNKEHNTVGMSQWALCLRMKLKNINYFIPRFVVSQPNII